MNSIFLLTCIAFAIQWIAFIFAAILRTEKFYDVIGSLTFVLIAFLTNYRYGFNHPRQEIQTTLIYIWAVRLGMYLLLRVLAVGKDKRFEKIIPKLPRFFIVWTLQGVWVIVTLLPTILSLQNLKQNKLNFRDYLGWLLWTVGFFIETISDFQKAAFKLDPLNKDKFITSGLWSLSRHPNYFGEIMLWFGLYISASSNFTSYEFLSVLCPIFNYFLITKVSGIPLLEKEAIKKWGHLTEYRAYVESTPKLFLKFSK